jgi:hypothetical protein
MALVLDNPYTTQGVVFGSSAEIIEVHEIVKIPSVSVVLEFESEDENLPPKRIPVVVWSGEEYPGFGEWTKADLETRLEEILS